VTTPFATTLRSLNLKATPKRIAMMEILAEKPVYFSPEDVWRRLRERFEQIGLPTVYRNLDDLTRGGVVIKIIHPDRRLYYYFCDHPDEHHHHFVCVSCRKVEYLGFCGLGQIEKEVETGLRGRVLSHLLQVYGLCRDCAAIGVSL
jgi:Fe2+ or Zn2+ uptake regulation protein